MNEESEIKPLVKALVIGVGILAIYTAYVCLSEGW